MLTLLSISIVNNNLVVWSALLEGLLSFYGAGSLVAYILKHDDITVDELSAADVTFTLFAWGYAYFYLVCQVWIPISFLFATHPGEPLTFIELLSLSFTNLSATGLGDMVPVRARVLAMIEQFTGVGYVAVVVSQSMLSNLISNSRSMLKNPIE